MDEHAERPYKVGWYRESGVAEDNSRHYRIDKNTLVIAYDDCWLPIRKKIYTKHAEIGHTHPDKDKKYLMLDGHNKNAHKTFLKDWCLMMKGGSIDDYEKVKATNFCLDECCGDVSTPNTHGNNIPEAFNSDDDAVPMGGEIAVAQITADTKRLEVAIKLLKDKDKEIISLEYDFFKLLKDKDKEIISLEYDLSHAADINTTQQKQIERLTTELKDADIALTQVLKNLNK